jgi:acetophenone carboxylase
MKGLLAESDSSLPATLDQLLEGKNPEKGKAEFRHITMPVEPFMNGETFYVACGGGAGYGDPLDRNPEAVIKDLREGSTSHWAAQNIYKVVYDEKTLRLDPEQTEALREKTCAERKKRGKPYNEFEAEWLKLRPPEGILKCFGTYPHPSEGIKAGPPPM